MTMVCDRHRQGDAGHAVTRGGTDRPAFSRGGTAIRQGRSSAFPSGRHAAEPANDTLEGDESRLMLAALVDLAAAGFAVVPLGRVRKAR